MVDSVAMINLKGLSRADLEAFFLARGERPYRAVQVMDWIYKKGVEDPSRMTNIPLPIRKWMAETSYISRLEMLERNISADGTVKYLWALEDGETVESVLIPEGRRYAACISSQAGCRMGCRICASNLGGFARHLTVAEIVDQVLRVDLELRAEGHRVSHVVVMGCGEPLDNYAATVEALRLLHAPEALNISFRRLTVSTCGLVPRILDLAGEGLPITLSVSLHAASDALRNKLMPVNRRYPLAELLDACRRYASATGRRVTFEYCLLQGVNDGVKDVRELGRLLRGLACHVNVIPFNPVPGVSYRSPPLAAVNRFCSLLRAEGVSVTLRRRRGADIDAACGQLRRRFPGRTGRAEKAGWEENA